MSDNFMKLQKKGIYEKVKRIITITPVEELKTELNKLAEKRILILDKVTCESLRSLIFDIKKIKLEIGTMEIPINPREKILKIIQIEECDEIPSLETYQFTAQGLNNDIKKAKMTDEAFKKTKGRDEEA